eukprot:s3370_g9.t1
MYTWLEESLLVFQIRSTWITMGCAASVKVSDGDISGERKGRHRPCPNFDSLIGPIPRKQLARDAHKFQQPWPTHVEAWECPMDKQLSQLSWSSWDSSSWSRDGCSMKQPDRRLHERHLEKLGQFQHVLELPMITWLPRESWQQVWRASPCVL